MLKIGIYTRKSIYSDTSDSTDVQYKLGSEYCKSHYTDYELLRYEDEGFTGANTNRPGYTKLISDVNDNILDVVVCYKIDRVSRDIKDFSNFYTLLSDHGVEFISIKEQLDTSTPLGRAMMYICSVFSQMERETIAERVTDNMIELSKSGKWAGGKPPLGFERHRIQVGGKMHTILIENPSEIPFLNMIADTFLNGNFSLNGLETYFRANNIKTLAGCYLSSTQIYTILKNPHYCAADRDALEYFKSLGCTIGCDEKNFTGDFGIMAYGRTSGGKRKKHTVNPPEKWIISVGLHHPLMSSEKWLAIQSRFGQNTFNKTRKHNIGLMKGVLKCSCGHTMQPKRKIDKVYNKVYDSYFCPNRTRRGVAYCSQSSISIESVDNAVIDILKNIALDKNMVEKYTYNEGELHSCLRSRSDVQRNIDAINTKMANLTSALSANSSSSAAKYIIAEMEKLDKQIAGLKFELLEIENHDRKRAKIRKNNDDKHKAICHIVDCLDTADYDEINGLLNNVLKECVWDGVSLKVKI